MIYLNVLAHNIKFGTSSQYHMWLFYIYFIFVLSTQYLVKNIRYLCILGINDLTLTESLLWHRLMSLSGETERFAS